MEHYNEAFFFKLSSGILGFQVNLNGFIVQYIPSIQASSGILMQVAKISKKIYNFMKLLKKQSCDMHTFTCHALVLPATTSSTVCCP
jgi:hypothetical protein